MKAKKIRLPSLFISSIALAAALAGTAIAQPGQRTMTDDQVSAQYDEDMKHCNTLQGNAADVCEEQAKAKRDAAKADAKANKESAEARQEANKEKRDAQYDVEKERCDSLSGDAKDQCIAEVKTKYGK